VLDVIRVATYINQIPTALDMVKDAHDKGYETTVNLMAASIIPDRELDEGLEMLAKSETKAIYLVDSFGAFYSEQMRYMVKKYLSHCKPAGKESGCIRIIICSWPIPIPLRESSRARIIWTRPWRVWGAGRGIARWNC